MKPRGYRYRMIRLPLAVANGLVLTTLVLLLCIVMLFVAYNIQRGIIGDLDSKLSIARAEAEEATRLNQAWEVHFQTWVNRTVEDELTRMSATPLMMLPPSIATPEEEGKYQDDMTVEDALANVIRDFGSTEESGPGR